MQFTWKKCKELTSRHFEYFKSKYPKRDILNLKNKDLAFKLYKKHKNLNNMKINIFLKKYI